MPVRARAQAPDVPAPSPAPLPQPIHDRFRLAGLIHIGAPIATGVEVDGREVPDQELNRGAGATLMFEAPLSTQFAIVALARTTRWSIDWEERVGYSSRQLYELSIAPKLGFSTGRLDQVQLYVQAPIGIAVDHAQDERFSGMNVSVDTATGVAYGATAGIQVLFKDVPVGIIGELGARWYAFSHRYEYSPNGDASFERAREEVSYHLGWVVAQVGLLVSL